MLSFAESKCAAIAESAIVVDAPLLASAPKRSTGLHLMTMLSINLKNVLLRRYVLVT